MVKPRPGPRRFHTWGHSGVYSNHDTPRNMAQFQAINRNPKQDLARLVTNAAYDAPGDRPETVQAGPNRNIWHYKPLESDKRRAVYERFGDRLVGLRGTNSFDDAWHTWPQIGIDAITRELPFSALHTNLLDNTEIGKQDEYLYQRLSKKIGKNNTITFTGHSMGADRARNLAARHKDVHSYGFNSGRNVTQNILFGAKTGSHLSKAYENPAQWLNVGWDLTHQVDPIETSNYVATAPPSWSPLYGLAHPYLKHGQF